MNKKNDEFAYVYITLPGQTSAVLVGRFDLTTRNGAAVGRFAYARSYRERREAVELDPRELNLSRGSFDTAGMGGVFGALRDATPDSWGRRLIERRVSGDYAELSPITYMLLSPEDRAGALGFGLSSAPPAPTRDFNRTLDLNELVTTANAILASGMDANAPRPTGADAEQIERLLLRGTGMGGARPKATVEDDGALWVAKFPITANAALATTGDRWNNPRVEHAMMTLARECGIACAETRLMTVGGLDVLLSKRFDRKSTDEGYERTRVISGLTMLGLSDEDTGKWSYLELADEIKRRSGHGRAKQLRELFCRIAFNALISNIDDHPRNHAFLGYGSEWVLAPAYDLTPTPMVSFNRDLAMSLGDFGRAATRENLMSKHGHFGFVREEAEAIVDGMARTVQMGWHRIARTAGVSEADCETIMSAFVCEGFGAKGLGVDEAEDLVGDDGLRGGPGRR